MASFPNFGIRETDRFTLQDSPLEVPDAVYEAGDPVTVSGGGMDYMTTFVGYEENTNYPIFQIIGGSDQIIGTDISRREQGGFTLQYGPANPIITNEPFGIGVITFSNYGTQLGPDLYHFQGVEFKFGQGVYEAGDPVMIEALGSTLEATFVGYERGTFYPVFQVETTRYIATNEAGSSGTFYTADEIVTEAYTTCFAPGTLIATPDGERPVETLRPGDRVLTSDGGVTNVKWVGVQKVPTLFGPPEVTRPVRIMAGALYENTPHTDLIVTKDHGMILDGVICNAGALINGTSIVEVSPGELNRELADEPGTGQPGSVYGVATWYHVETHSHVPLLANGAAAESFIDNVGRSVFGNHAEFVAMYGAWVPAMAEMGLPRAMSARQVPKRITSRLATRAAAIFPSAVMGASAVRGAVAKSA